MPFINSMVFVIISRTHHHSRGTYLAGEHAGSGGSYEACCAGMTPPATAQPVALFGPGACALDLTCFDKQFPCDACCSTGLTPSGLRHVCLNASQYEFVSACKRTCVDTVAESIENVVPAGTIRQLRMKNAQL